MDLTIRPVRRDEIAGAADVLAVAFAADPVMRHLWPGARHRRWALPRYFRTTLTIHHVPWGAVEVAVTQSGDLVGVAVWDPPGRWNSTVVEFARAGLPLALAFGQRIPAALRTRRRLDRIHPPAPHWYLCHLAVLPERQRQGIGTALLRSRCARCDDGSQAAYLVCTRESNMALYTTAGFATTTPFELDGMPLWPMWRHPHPRTAKR
ncbi:GNAT family N-acetyltransferase [Nocardia arthritidis]|uniref:GNAT family N-acetyltransferase n=1 Tax=Nocardia arthritidis TaxID=228602 RepID=A0A6G9Y9B3_9NOCA|nr:GNAT family N-acetyltransferase [Nocardia arthritidis]QIS09812.1 GNAT family N-acetyltransferase [Nocardia arthritidis]